MANGWKDASAFGKAALVVASVNRAALDKLKDQ